MEEHKLTYLHKFRCSRKLPPLKLQLWTYFLRYFHKVPVEAPQLELKASYGLAEPIPFELPPLSELCTAEVYATFDLTKGAKNDKVLWLTSRLFQHRLDEHPVKT